ncbi:MAG: 5-oxoprolinase subunit PxpB [Bdellovibrionia bacterium]
MKLKQASDRAILLDFSSEQLASPDALAARVRAWFHCLQNSHDLGLTSVQPAYSTILVKYDPLTFDPDSLCEKLQSLSKKIISQNTVPLAREVRVPVCYEAPYAPDLETVARSTGLSPSEIIKRHSSAVYSVYFLGFMPGFAYLGGLPPELSTPRLSTPRRLVPKGSVGIAGSQTGVYPVESPGGWQIIGRTPANLFDATRENPALLGIGDRVHFEAITSDEFERLSS